MKNKKKSSFNSKKSISEIKQLEFENRSKNELIIKESDNISILNVSEFIKKNKNESNKNLAIKVNNEKNMISFEEDEKNNKIKRIMERIQNNNVDSTHFNKDSFQKNLSNVNNKDSKDSKKNKVIHLNIFNYYCYRKNTKNYKYINLYNLGNLFYRNKMDITHVFSLLSILENFIKKK